MAVQFEDYRIQVKAKMNDCVSQFLEEAAAEVESQTKRNQTRIDTGQTKGGWTHVVDESKREAVVGNPLENAIWEEFGKKIQCRIKIGQNRRRLSLKCTVLSI